MFAYGVIVAFGAALALAGALEAWRARRVAQAPVEVAPSLRTGLIGAGLAHVAAGTLLSVSVCSLAVFGLLA